MRISGLTGFNLERQRPNIISYRRGATSNCLRVSVSRRRGEIGAGNIHMA